MEDLVLTLHDLCTAAAPLLVINKKILHHFQVYRRQVLYFFAGEALYPQILDQDFLAGMVHMLIVIQRCDDFVSLTQVPFSITCCSV